MGHPLATLRREIELSQTRLAERMACSFDAVRSIETGRLPLTVAMTRKVFLATGAVIDGDEVKNLAGEPYTKADFAEWIERGAVDLLTGETVSSPRFLALIGCAMVAARHGDALGRVQARLVAALFDAVFAEGIQNDFRRIANDRGPQLQDDFKTAARLAGRLPHA